MSFLKKGKEEPTAIASDVTPEIIEELTYDEQRDRLHLERKVERAFYEAGKALRELRDRRLYRSSHRTFEEYCRDRFSFKRRHSYQLIDAANVVDNLLVVEENSDSTMCANGAQNETVNSPTDLFFGEGEATESRIKRILPSSERQVRPLTKLENPAQQREAWRQAVAQAGGKIPSGRIVKEVVQLFSEKTPVTNPYRVGEICRFVPKDNPELKGKSKCWAIVKEVFDFSCMVRAWDGEYQVRIEHLKSQELSPAQREQVQQLCARITKLRQIDSLDQNARAFLKNLGEQLYLSELGEKMLRVIEEHYKP